MSDTRTPDTFRFPHERLDAYRVAVELFRAVETFAASFPSGFADLRDQLRRAAGAMVRNLAEGANRTHPRDKAARFAVALGECAECAAVLEMAALVGLGDTGGMRALAGRVGAMLAGLVRRQRMRAGAS